MLAGRKRVAVGAAGVVLLSHFLVQGVIGAPSLAFTPRHGDHEEHLPPEGALSSSSIAAPTATQAHEESHSHDHEPAHEHHHHHMPSELSANLTPIAIPYLPLYWAGGGHQHSHSNAPAEVDLNETSLFESKGPEPLSYLAWDIAYGLGSADRLRSFASEQAMQVDSQSEYGAMAQVGGRYRKLTDELDADARRAIAEDIRSRVGTQEEPLEPTRHTWLLVLHVVGATLSCFFLLPLALFLRAASSSLAPVASVAYLVLLASSLFLSTIYKALTPKLYPSNAHGRLGWVILWLSVLCLGGDIVALVRQFGQRSRTGLRRIINAGGDHGEQEKMLDAEQTDDLEDRYQREPSSSRPHVHFAGETPSGSGEASPTSTLIGGGSGSTRNNSLTDALAAKLHGHHQQSSSTGTLPKRTRILRNALAYTHVVVTRALPVIAFAGAYTGLAVYAGTCRKATKNGCLAHGIKGGIFFWYGLLTFARYLGAYADCGWAWNRRPSPRDARRGGGRIWKANVPSAEFVECLVIFAYGASNTWMERFAAKPGDPYTVKQVQHISIAVMYWFAGALGLLLETRWVRDLLNFPIALGHPSAPKQHRGEVVPAQTPPPPSYAASFNPFPALCIGLTGIVMSAHHQDYVYEVQVHMLWGNLLAGFAVLRCLTYAFLWLRPPASVLPSRPPTEALASFSLTCGGLVFMISTEEVSFAAMRNGFGDFMAILCISAAAVCFILALVAALFLVKAWAATREFRRKTNAEVTARLHSGAGGGGGGEAMSGEPVFVLGDEDADDGPAAGGESAPSRGVDDERGPAPDSRRLLSSSPEHFA